MTTRASDVSRLVRIEAGRMVQRLIHFKQDGEATFIHTMNGTRHQAVALSKARRALERAGYTVEVGHGYGSAPLPLSRHVFHLRVTRGTQ